MSSSQTEALAKSAVIRNFFQTENFDRHYLNHEAMLARRIDDALKQAGYESHYFETVNQRTLADRKRGANGLYDVMVKEGIAPDVLRSAAKVHDTYYNNLLEELSERRRPSRDVSATPADHSRLNAEPRAMENAHTTNIKNLVNHRYAKYGAGAMGLAALGMGLKSYMTHLAPSGIEPIFLEFDAEEILNKGQRDLDNHRLTPKQFSVLEEATHNTLTKAIAASLLPDPTGMTTEKVVAHENEAMIKAMNEAGVSQSQAAQYKLGSLIEALEDIASSASQRLSNDNDIDHLRHTNNNWVPLSVVTGISLAQLQQTFGKMSLTLSGNALKTEVSRTDGLEKLKHLSVDALSELSSTVMAGTDPFVKVNAQHEIVSSLQPPELSKEYRTALWQAADYIIRTGNVEWNPPANTDIDINRAIALFAKNYKIFSADGELSEQERQYLQHNIYERLSENGPQQEKIRPLDLELK